MRAIMLGRSYRNRLVACQVKKHGIRATTTPERKAERTQMAPIEPVATHRKSSRIEIEQIVDSAQSSDLTWQMPTSRASILPLQAVMVTIEAW